MPDTGPALMTQSLTMDNAAHSRQLTESPHHPSAARVLTETVSPAVSYVDPTTGAASATSVLRAFDKPPQNWLPGHRGVDLALQVGSPVVAAGDGVVAFAGSVAGTPTISIDHADGIRTTYQPVHPLISRGEQVTTGQEIGRLAHPTDGWPGLHWGARIGEDYQNPLGLLSRPAIRLKPVDGPSDRPL
ncbi:M23 family metallopeptidase [Corynebacterium sp. A21]|uniref:M23 family metallopeptidase n=1 Tax=Corynebacterium sp. A21 TaxID=3457318 RepID=UPI003FCEF088